MSEITFIIPNRGGKYIDFVINQLRKFYPDEKYIVIEQMDNQPFNRGQIFNASYDYVDTEYMCFIDNDMFFNEYFDLIGTYNKLGCQVLMPWNIRDQVKVTGDTYEVIEDGYVDTWYKGSILFMTKEIFKKLNGFSNIFIGYGYDDIEFSTRCDEDKFVQVENTVCHIKHELRNSSQNIHVLLNEYSYYMAESDEHGGLDTSVFTKVYSEEINDVKYVGVKDFDSTNEKSRKYIDIHKQENRRKAYSIFYEIID